MNFKVANQFAFRNLFANRKIEMPYILSSGIMLMLFNIMASLAQNQYVKERHEMLPVLIRFGIIATGIFTFVFILYANSFLIRKRNKEISLYGVLGLEKKHIRGIMLIEQVVHFLIITAISVLGGYVIGKLMFLILNRLMQDEMAGVMEYPFSVTALGYTMGFILFIFVVLFFFNTGKIGKASSIQLMNSSKEGEKEPKVRKVILLGGFATLIAGYYIAITVEGTLKSLGLFFIAVLLVILASYSLFVSLSVLILKKQKSGESFYTDKKFLTVSGMLYRMKSNAVSLASIAILSTGVIVAVSATWTIYSNINEMTKTVMPREYGLESKENVTNENYESVKNSLYDAIPEDEGQSQDKYVDVYTFDGVIKNDNKLNPMVGKIDGTPMYVYFTTQESYNAKYNKNVKLSKDEVIVGGNSKHLTKGIDTLNIMDKDYRTRLVNNIVPGNIAIDSYVVVFRDLDDVIKAAQFYKGMNRKTNALKDNKVKMGIYWNARGERAEEYESGLKEIAGQRSMELSTFRETKRRAYELNGGFLFLGIIIGLISTIGTTLIIYYKQISEGNEDRDKYQIMKKVGLPDKLIKDTTKSQILWIFLSPLFVATIHSLVASKIVFQLLAMFGVRSYGEYGIRLGCVVLAFAVVYFVIFKLTSNAYYRIVK